MTWFSRTQKCVTLSTTEAEYVAKGDGVKEALFINGVLGFMLPGTTLKGIKVLEDNQGAIALGENPLTTPNSKHIDVRHHFVRGLCQKGSTVLEHVGTADQHADILTKTLPRDSSQKYRNFIFG